MRTLLPDFAAHLAGETTTLCRCWAITRRDGVVLGFTDHDRALQFDGVSFAAVTGIEAAEASSELGFAIGGGEVSGAFAATGLNEADLMRGLYDDARVDIWMVNWAAVTERLLLETAFIGEVKRGEVGFSAELRGLAKAFDEERGRLYLRSCDADLGDARCGVSVAIAEGLVASSDGRVGFKTISLDGAPDGHFTGGRLTFTAGGNLGFATEIKHHAARDGIVALQLWQAPPAEIRPGDAFTVMPGCDKSFATCRSKFGNGANFRGFPHLPSNDFILAGVRPGDGRLDGGSVFR